MTCIVAITHDNNVYLGADSAAVSGTDLRIRKDNKICYNKNKNYVIGFTSSYRMGQIIQNNFDPPMRDKNKNLYSYVYGPFLENLRKCLKEHGYTRISENKEEMGECILGIEGTLFHIYSDFSIGELDQNYDACGCGENYALGSLYETEKSMISNPTERILSALKAAKKFSSAVREPFEILTLYGNE